MPDKIVAIGLLTQSDLDVLGTGFKRLFQIDHDDQFADLIRRLDSIEGGKRVLSASRPDEP